MTQIYVALSSISLHFQQKNEVKTVKHVFPVYLCEPARLTQVWEAFHACR